MNGLYLAIGKQGCGKTAYIVYLAMLYKNKFKKIYSNIKSLKIDYEYVNKKILSENLTTDTHYYDNSIIIFDEIHTYYNSYDYASKENRIAQPFFSQLRKRNILCLGTTQYLMNLDVRIRRQASEVYEMTNLNNEIYKVDVYNVDGYFSSFQKTFHIKLNGVYEFYDTLEVIND